MSNGDDATQSQDSSTNSEQAERCRRLSRATYDRATSELLNRLAETFERGEPGQPANDSY